MHRFLVAHPEEVLILSIEDDTDAADTAQLIRDSGLIREVYRGPARPPWPTLRELIERNERVLVLIENDPGDEPWMHRQSEVAQETPYHFATRGGARRPRRAAPTAAARAGSLLLVNHWVDTSPAPRTTIAREVNARGFLEPRLARCRSERGLSRTSSPSTSTARATSSTRSARKAEPRSAISAPPVVATTTTRPTATSYVSSANPIPITPNWCADVASMCGIQITAQTPTPAMPIAVSTAPGSSRRQLTRRPSSRYGVSSHSSVLSASVAATCSQPPGQVERVRAQRRRRP